MYDTLISGGTVVDGSGRDPYVGDVAVENGEIAAIGVLTGEAAAHRIDATDMIVSPGFIDSHCHSELSLVADPSAESKVHQGVTTEILGNCGWSAFPVGATDDPIIDLSGPIFGHPEVTWEWSDLSGYFKRLASGGTTVNVATLVGHGNIRASVIGLEDRAATAQEIETMKSLVQTAMDQGAFGFSTGLAYPPGAYASDEEIVELATVSSQAGGLYATHMRDQVDGLVESVRETLKIGRQAKTKVLISHHKSVGQRNYGKVQQTQALVEDAISNGLDVSSDIYPYLAGSSSMLMLLPPWVWSGSLMDILVRLRDSTARSRIARELETGLLGWENRVRAVGWENIVIAHVGSERNRHLLELTVVEAGEKVGKSPLQFVCDLLLDERCNVGDLIRNSCEEDLRTVLTHPQTVIGSDGLDVGERPHPRLYGTFPKILGRYVREEAVFSLTTAVRKMSGQTADLFGLSALGYLRPGYRADVVVFDPATVRDTATYEDPRRFPVGIYHVLVGGVRSLIDGQLTGDHGGQVIRRGAK